MSPSMRRAPPTGAPRVHVSDREYNNPSGVQYSLRVSEKTQVWRVQRFSKNGLPEKTLFIRAASEAEARAAATRATFFRSPEDWWRTFRTAVAEPAGDALLLGPPRYDVNLRRARRK